MHILRLAKCLIVLLIFALLPACGSGSGDDTNGALAVSDLTVTDQTGGSFRVSGTSTYTPPSGKVPNGAQITLDTSFSTPTGTPTTRANTVSLDSTGIASFSYFVTQGTEPVLVTVTASIGGLKAQKSSSIPSIGALSATPSALTFSAADGAGVQKIITLSGGFAPYSAPTSTTSDLSVSLSGSTITVTKVPAAGSVQQSGSITVKDVRGNSIDISVTYFK